VRISIAVLGLSLSNAHARTHTRSAGGRARVVPLGCFLEAITDVFAELCARDGERGERRRQEQQQGQPSAIPAVVPAQRRGPEPVDQQEQQSELSALAREQAAVEARQATPSQTHLLSLLFCGFGCSAFLVSPLRRL
jgi:hypothetical protein